MLDASQDIALSRSFSCRNFPLILTDHGDSRYTRRNSMKRKNRLGLSRDEIEALFNNPQFANEYPLILNTEQVAKLLQLPIATIYQMSSQGYFATCAKRVGKHLRFVRTRLLQAIFNDLQP
jgi:hypothetical protein